MKAVLELWWSDKLSLVAPRNVLGTDKQERGQSAKPVDGSIGGSILTTLGPCKEKACAPT